VAVIELGKRRSLMRNPKRKCDKNWLGWSSYKMTERGAASLVEKCLESWIFVWPVNWTNILDSVYLIWQLEYCLKTVYALNKMYVILQFAYVLDLHLKTWTDKARLPNSCAFRRKHGQSSTRNSCSPRALQQKLVESPCTFFINLQNTSYFINF
jgi:hypothetical protein